MGKGLRLRYTFGLGGSHCAMGALSKVCHQHELQRSVLDSGTCGMRSVQPPISARNKMHSHCAFA